MQLLLSLIQGFAMSGVLHPVDLPEVVSRSSAIALVRATDQTGTREVPGTPRPCRVPWREYEVVEVLREPANFRLPRKIQVEPSDARYNCRIAEAMNSPLHPILLIDSYRPSDSAGLADPSLAKVLFLKGNTAQELAETVLEAKDGPAVAGRIRKLLVSP